MGDHRNPQILVLTTTTDVGGMPRITTALLRQLSARGWRTRYIFPFHQPDEESTVAWYRDQGVLPENSAVAPQQWLRRSPRDLLALRQFVARYRPEIVNIHYGDNTISLKDILVLRLAGRHRCVVSVHHPTPLNGIKLGKRRMTGLAAWFTHDVVVFSRATRDSLREDGVPARKIHVIPCGLPVPDRLPHRADARRRLGLPVDAFLVGVLARLVPEKGIADLIHAIARIADSDNTLRLIIAGSGPAKDALQVEAAASLGDAANFLGRIPDTADFYAALDLFVLPSYMEGFGLAFVEAAFYGVPSIGTTAGGIPDAIHDGVTGLLVPPGNVAELAAAIQSLRNNPELRQTMGNAARARAYAEFTEELMVERFAKVFHLE